MILKIENLSKHYESGRFLAGRETIKALNGVSFQLSQRSTLGVVGESGCGKSTLGKSLLRLIEPTSGKVFFEDVDLLTLNREELRKKRREMQIIFQDPFSSLNPRMNVRSILEEPFIIQNQADNLEPKIRNLLEQVGLNHAMLNRKPHEFSGGQRQRIGIARALALKPKLIVADEPVSALDVSVQSQILNLLMDLKRDLGITFIFISHDLAVVEHISDEVAIMYLGKIVEQAPTETIYSDPKHPYTKALLKAIPVADPTARRKLEGIGGDALLDETNRSGCSFAPRCPLADDKCRSSSPEFQELADGPHKVACHHV